MKSLMNKHRVRYRSISISKTRSTKHILVAKTNKFMSNSKMTRNSSTNIRRNYNPKKLEIKKKRFDIRKGRKYKTVSFSTHKKISIYQKKDKSKEQKISFFKKKKLKENKSSNSLMNNNYQSSKNIMSPIKMRRNGTISINSFKNLNGMNNSISKAKLLNKSIVNSN